MKTLTRVETAAVAVVAAQAIAAAAIWWFGATGPIPLHFSGGGIVDRWGDRHQVAGLLAGLALLHATLQGVLAVATRPAVDQRRGLAVAQGVLIATMLGITVWMTWLATGASAAQAPRVLAVGLCALFAGIGAVLGKVAPNPLVGIRTPWTRTSRLAWDKSNRLAGRLFFLGGLAGMMLTPLLPPFLAIRSITAAALLIAAVCVFESWRVWRADPDRLPA